MSKSFQEIIHDAQQFEGMISDFDIAVLHNLLTLQEQYDITGHLFETGVYKGKSATILKNHLQANEKLILVDVSHEYASGFLKVHQMPSIQFVESSSEEFLKKSKELANSLKKNCRLLHADGSHTFQNVYNDLKLADKFLSEKGIVVLDDFNNTFYPQVQAATYKFMYTEWTDLKMFLISNNKGILCRKSMLEFYKDFCFKKLIGLMEDQGVMPMASKTDRDSKFDVLSLHPRAVKEESKIYGEQLYGHFFA